MKHSYIIVDDSEVTSLNTREIMRHFPEYSLVNVSSNFADALDAILKFRPSIVFLEISSPNCAGSISLSLISETHRFLSNIPKFVITASDSKLALAAIDYQVFDYIIKPVDISSIRKCLLRYEKTLGTELLEAFDHVDLESNSNITHNTTHNSDEQDNLPGKILIDENDEPLIICIKSYGDYRFIEASNISYLKADNNSTDIHLKTGEVITAFKTLKSFETTLPLPFVRIHNSYIINITAISRIHTGNSMCHLVGSTLKIPFSKSYKDNVDKIISSIEGGNYIEF